MEIKNQKIRQIELLNCETIIPTNWNIYKWVSEHPNTTIAHSVKRIEKLMDISDFIYSGFSAGKDSTVTANLLMLELNLRKLRVKNGIDRDGNDRIDPLDKKWANKRISMMMTDAEVVFSDSNNYTKRFLSKYGPEGLDLLEFNWMCYPLAWQSGVSFNSGILISWDEDIKDMWVQQMPTSEDLHGFDPLSIHNENTSNMVRLDSLSKEAQEFHRLNDHVVMAKVKDLFNGDKSDNTEVEAVCNYGRGPIKFISKGQHEKELQDDYSFFFANTSWLVDKEYDNMKESIFNELYNRYGDLEKDVILLTQSGNDPLSILNKNNKGYIKDDINVDKLRVSTAAISLRAEESLDRRVILSQSEYSTGQYANNNGVNIASPVFDYSTQDIWRLLSATNWDVNDTYQKLYEIGVGIGDQRIGSLLNYAAVRQISTVKALEPDLYGRINARFQNVEFMSQFSRAGYFKIGRPRDASWDGRNHLKAGVSLEEQAYLSDRYEEVLIELNIPYKRKDNIFISDDKAFFKKPWFPIKNYLKENKGKEIDKKEYLEKLDNIHTSWKDYMYVLLNSTPNPVRDIWREKIITSILHWKYDTGSISEGNLAALEVLSELPNDLTEKLVDYSIGNDYWSKHERLKRSKRMNVTIGKYPQESLSEMARITLNYIANNLEKYSYLFDQSESLRKIWDFAQKSRGESIIPDEALTLILEKPVDDSKPQSWIDLAELLYTEGHSGKYEEYFKSKKIEGYPFAIKEDIVGDSIITLPDNGTIEDAINNFIKVLDVFFREDVSWSPCYKKLCICILKNDVTMKYAGFGPTLRERKAREEAISAFSANKEEKELAKKKAQRMAKDIEKEILEQEEFKRMNK